MYNFKVFEKAVKSINKTMDMVQELKTITGYDLELLVELLKSGKIVLNKKMSEEESKTIQLESILKTNGLWLDSDKRFGFDKSLEIGTIINFDGNFIKWKYVDELTEHEIMIDKFFVVMEDEKKWRGKCEIK